MQIKLKGSAARLLFSIPVKHTNIRFRGDQRLQKSVFTLKHIMAEFCTVHTADSTVHTYCMNGHFPRFVVLSLGIS